MKFTYILDLLLPELSGFPIFWLSVHDEGVVRTKLDIYVFLIYSYIPQLHCELPLAVFVCFNAVISCAMFFNVASFPLTSAFSCRITCFMTLNSASNRLISWAVLVPTAVTMRRNNDVNKNDKENIRCILSVSESLWYKTEQPFILSSTVLSVHIY